MPLAAVAGAARGAALFRRSYRQNRFAVSPARRDSIRKRGKPPCAAIRRAEGCALPFRKPGFTAKISVHPERPLFHVELDQGSSVHVVVTNIRAEKRMFVWIYELEPASDCAPLGSRLAEVLRRRWPTLVPCDES
jgi:hypothetical protein